MRQRKRRDPSPALCFERGHLAKYRVGVVVGRAVVADQHVGAPAFERFERIGNGGGRADGGAALLQNRLDELAAFAVSVEHEHPHAIEQRGTDRGLLAMQARVGEDVRRLCR